MQKEIIRYNGFTEQPSDYECPDGDLAAVSGLIPEDEALRPIAEPQALFTLPDGCLISFIHTGIGYKHYIIKHEYDAIVEEVQVHKTDFYWLDSAAIDSAEPKPVEVLLPSQQAASEVQPSVTASLIHSFDNITTYKIDGIGNTIVILTDSGMHYCLWQNQAYKYLGNHLPEIQLSFGMRKEAARTISTDIYINDGIIRNYNNEEKSWITNNVLGSINSWVTENHSLGFFIFPFFVRYAYRLYDGTTLTMHSAPVLMIPNTRAPHVYINQIEGTHYQYYNVEDAQRLDFAFIGDDNMIANIRNWSDIIQSVDIFISSPFQTYDQNGEVWRATNHPDWVIDYTENTYDYGVRNDYDGAWIPNSTDPNRKWVTFRSFYPSSLTYTRKVHNSGVGANIVGLFDIPMKPFATILEEISNCHTFYFLKSIPLESLTTERRDIVVEGYLPTIHQQEVMTDDWDSHDLIKPQYSFVYNQRLNLAGIIKQITRGYNIMGTLCHSDSYITFSDDDYYFQNPQNQGDQTISVTIYLKKDGKEVIVHDNLALARYGTFGKFHPIPYYYYPDKDAYKALIHYIKVDGMSVTHIYRLLNLSPHPYLNGAYFVTPFDAAHNPGELYYQDVAELVIPEQNRIISLPNRIYTSEVNNPFAFPVKGITTIGTGSIMGIKAAVKALSPSQFGQFPLYAFSTEGVWALAVKSDGSYSASQPVTLDVCISADSITQIESAVLFATQRGIMLISGSTSTCISDNINSKLAFDLDTLPGLRQLIGEEIADSLDHVHFIEYLQQARMLFDYTHQRIIVYNPNHNYAYAYSLKSKQWGMLLSYIKDTPNSYPDALAFAELPTEGGGQTNTILNYSAEKAGADYTETKKLIITRPLKLDIADQLKTIDTIIQRGQFRKGHVKTILYGSRDLFNWQLVYSSTDHYLRGFRGTPYKYFRIALLCEGMAPDESIFGCSVEYTPRLTNKLR